jgi:carbonic anhydrase/acetyltransferase-like protein (isoleucine patch superfamily)
MTTDIRALILVPPAAELPEDKALPISPALLDVAGATPLQRMAERLTRQSTTAAIALVSANALPQSCAVTTENLEYRLASPRQFWRAAEDVFNEMVEAGAEQILVISLDQYAEVDFDGLVQVHLERKAQVTQVSHGPDVLHIFCVSGSRRNDAAVLFRSQLAEDRGHCQFFHHDGYISPLKTARDIRQFAIDILTLKTETQPAFEQIRPGIWVSPSALIEKGARILAPAFVGAFAKVRAGAVITRCSTIEHHAEIDCGTVVENSTVLPYSCVGAALDLAHSVVGTGRIDNLRRNATAEIADPKLIHYVSPAPLRRLSRSAFDFVTYLPRQAWRGLFGPSQPQPVRQETQARPASTAGPAREMEPSTEFPANLAVVRRYGHQ